MSSSDIPVVNYTPVGEKKNINSFWWKSDKESLHNDVFGVVTRIRSLQSYRKRDYLINARLYSNVEFDKYISGVIAGRVGEKLTFNVSKSCVDTACAKISQNKTRPLFLTSKGTKQQQNRAKKLTQYMDGVFFQGRVYEQGRDCFRDGAIFGTGALKVFDSEGEVSFERVFIDEIVVDDIDGRFGKPRQMHQEQVIHREVLRQAFINNPEAVKHIDLVDAESNPNKTGVTEMIKVIESWHLPSSMEKDDEGKLIAKDGRHTICIKNFPLLDEEWKHDKFPFAFFKWDKPLLGFYGEGLVTQLVGIQLEINMLLMRIKEAQELMAVPRIFVEEGSSVNTANINDEIGGIIKYRGSKPEAMNWTAMNPEIYNYLEYLFKKAFEITGVSQLSASSKKPSGLDSKVALMEFQDIETERFAMVAESYQQFFLDITEIAIDIQRELAEQNSKLSVNVKGKKFIETIKWKEVDMDDDKFIMQVFPTNFLPKTPEGKLQFTQELIQSGFIDPDWALELLDFPDLEGFFNLKTAAIDDIENIIDKIIEDEDYTAPEEYMNLQLAVQISQSAYLRAKTDGTSETSKELLQRFIDDCQDLIKQMTPPAPPVPAPQQQAPENGRPQKAPRSDLIPYGGAQQPS